jgi:hypothetical protein
MDRGHKFVIVLKLVTATFGNDCSLSIADGLIAVTLPKQIYDPFPLVSRCIKRLCDGVEHFLPIS